MASLKELGYDLYGLPGKQIKLATEETETENVLGSMLPTEPSTGNTRVLSKPGVNTEDKVEKDGTIMPDKVENGSAGPETTEDPDDGSDDVEINDSDMESDNSTEDESTDEHPAGMPQPPDPPEGQVVKDEAARLESVAENARIMAERFSGTPMYPKYLHVYNEAVNNLNAFKGINRSFFEAPGDEDDNSEEPSPDPGEEGDEPSPDDGGEAPTEEPTDDAPTEPEADTGDDSSEENLDDINVANGEGDIADDSPENPDAGADPNAVDTETEPPKDPKDPEVDLNDYKNGIRAKTFQKSLDNAKERMERATDPELKKRYKAEYDSIKENFELYKKKNDNSQELSADSYEDMTEDAKGKYQYGPNGNMSKKTWKKFMSYHRQMDQDAKNRTPKSAIKLWETDLKEYIADLSTADARNKLEKARVEIENGLKKDWNPRIKVKLLKPSATPLKIFNDNSNRNGKNTAYAHGFIKLFQVSGYTDTSEDSEANKMIDALEKYSTPIIKRFIPKKSNFDLDPTMEIPVKEKFFKKGLIGMHVGKTYNLDTMYTESVIDTIEGGTAMGYFDDMTELFKESSIYGEAANISPEMKPIIEKLNKKGYKTKYSSPGYEKERSKSDREPDGIKNGKLYSTARLMFDGDYNLPPAPDGWTWRQVEKNDYLDVKEKSFDKADGDPDEAFKQWKDEYMKSLSNWVDELPDAGTNNGDSSRNPDADSDHTEVRESASIFDFGDDMLNEFLEETMDDFTSPSEDEYVSEGAVGAILITLPLLLAPISLIVKKLVDRSAMKTLRKPLKEGKKKLFYDVLDYAIKHGVKELDYQDGTDRLLHATRNILTKYTPKFEALDKKMYEINTSSWEEAKPQVKKIVSEENRLWVEMMKEYEKVKNQFPRNKKYIKSDDDISILRLAKQVCEADAYYKNIAGDDCLDGFKWRDDYLDKYPSGEFDSLINDYLSVYGIGASIGLYDDCLGRIRIRLK